MLMKAGKILFIIVLFLFVKNSYSQCTADFSSDINCLTVTFTDDSDPGGSAIDSWLWTFTGVTPGNFNGQNPPDITYTTSGVYNVKLEIHTADGCTDIKNGNVNIPSQPAASFTTTLTCPYTINFTGGIGNATSFEWDFGDGNTNSSEQNPVHTYSGAGTYTVTLTTSTSSCTVSYQEDIIIYPELQPDFSFVQSDPCSFFAVDFTDQTIGGSDNTFEWDFGDGTFSTEQNPSHVFNAYGNSTQTYSVTLTVTNQDNGCSSTSTSQSVTVTQRPDATLFENNFTNFNNCGNASPTNPNFTIDVSYTPSVVTSNTYYDIDWGDGTSNYSSPNAPMNITHTYTALGVYDLTFTVTAANGCNDTKIFPVLNISTPAVGIGAPGNTTGCADFDVVFTVSNNCFDNYAGTYYNLEFGDGAGIYGITQNQLQSTYTHTYSTSSCPGEYVAVLTAYNDCTPQGVESTVTGIKVYSHPDPEFEIDGSPGFQACEDVLVYFNNLSNGANNNFCSSEIVSKWEWGDGSAPTIIFSDTYPYQQVSHMYNDPGTYTVTLTTTNFCNSNDPSSISHEVCIEAAFAADFNLIAPANSCAPYFLDIDNISDTSQYCDNNEYTWTVPGFDNGDCSSSTGDWDFSSGTAHSPTPQFVFHDAGEYTIRMVLDNACVDAGVVNQVHEEMITVFDKPNLISIENIEDGCESLVLEPNAQFEECYAPVDTATGFSWSFAGGSPSSSNQNPPGIISYNTPGNYTITVTASNVCGTSNELVETVIINPDIVNNTISCPSDTLCQGDIPGIIDGTDENSGLTGGNGFYNYEWQMSNDSLFPSGNTSVVGGNTPDLDLGQQLLESMWFRRIVTSGGCSDTSLACQIIVVPGIINNTIGDDQDICVGEIPDTLMHIGAPLQGGSGIYSYKWFFRTDIPNGSWTEIPMPFPGTSFYGPPALTQTTQYKRVVNSIPEDNCDSESNIVTINVYILPEFTSDTTPPIVCSGVPLDYQLQANIAGTTFSWYVESNPPACISGYTTGVQTTGAISDELINSCSDIQTIRYYVTPIGPGPTSCPGPEYEVLFTVDPVIDINAGADNQINDGSYYMISDAYANGGSGGLTINWLPDLFVDNTVINPQTIPLTSPPNIYQFTLTVNDTAGCQVEDDIVLTIAAGSGLDVSIVLVPPGNDTICNGDSIQLDAQATGGTEVYSYTWWSEPAGFTWNQQTTPHLFPDTTTIYWVIADDGVSQDSASYKIVVDQIPEITSPLAWEMCSNSTVNYQPLSNVANTSYEWYSTNTVPECIYENINTGQSLINAVLSNSCSTPQDIIYTVTPTGPPGTFCPGEAVDVVITVNPLVALSPSIPDEQTVISGTLPQNVTFSSPFDSVYYVWHTDGNVNLQAPYDTVSDGTGDTLGFLSTGPVYITSGDETVELIYYITPYYQGDSIDCPGVIFEHKIIINQTPQVFNVMGGGTFCDDGINCADIWLDGSQEGVVYQLMKGSVLIGDTISGNGSPIYWNCIMEGGQYTVLSKNANTGASIFMNGGAVITANPLPVVYELVPTGDTCLPIIPRLNGSQAGVAYQLFIDGSPMVPNVIEYGTGNIGFLLFPEQNLEGVYTVLAIDTTTGCQQFMNNSIVTHPLPEQYTIRPNGILCEGEFIWLEHSQPEVMYQLWFDQSPYGNIVYGKADNDSISFGYIQDPGTYTIHAWDTIWGCEVIFDSTIVLNENPLIYSITPSEGCPGTEIILNGCQEDVFYYLLFEPEVADDIVVVDSMECQGATFLNFGPQYEAGTYYVKAISQSSLCVSYMQDSTVIHPAPQQFNVTPSGGGCPPQEIALDGCEADVVYYLYLNGVQISSDSCTDGVIDFGFQNDVGIYTVKGKRTYASGLECWSDMKEQFEVYSLPQVYSLSPSGTFCPPQEILLTGSEPGVNYYLFNDNIGYVDTIVGTGGLISFGQQTEEGTYHIEAENDSSCMQIMDNTITLLPEPIVYNLEPSGNLCTETELWLSNSQIGLSYQLYLNGSIQIGPLVAGDGDSISFGLQSQMGFYTVRALTNTVPGCAAIMEDTAYISPLTIYSLTPQGIFCPGEEIFLNGSDTGIQYELYIDNSTTGIIIEGTGNQISFGQQFISGVYTVIATDTTLLCYASMTGACTIEMAPTEFAISPQGGYCPPQTISLDSCEPGVTYYLYRDGIEIAQDSCENSSVNFGQQNLPGNYTIKAKTTYPGSLECWSDMQGNLIIYDLPVAYSLNPVGNHCSPVNIGLNGSETGISYYLYYNDDVIDTVVGTGSQVDFGEYSMVGNYYAKALNTTGCELVMFDTVTILPEPQIFNLEPSDTLCSGEELWLSNSQEGVLYQLILNGTNILNTVNGDGAPISFGIQSQAGTYSVIANTESSPSCSAIMNGLTVIEPLTQYSIIPQGISCPAVEIKLNGSQQGVEYVLWRNGGAVVPSNIVQGTGQMISFGEYNLAGTYTIHANTPDNLCDAIMLDTCIIQQSPTVFNIQPAGISCLDDSISISLSGSGAGILYMLYRDGAYQQFLIGTGSAIDFGVQAISGNYTVKAVDTISDCQIWMNDTVFLKAPPISYSMIPQGLHCSDTIVSLNGSEIGVAYKLIRNGTEIIDTVFGTGFSINFGLISSQGIYTVIAIDTATNCDTEITGELNLTSGPLVFNLTASGDSIYCENTLGDTLRLDNSQSGVEYQLYKIGTPDEPIDAPQDGIYGTPLFWYNIEKGSYYVKASYPEAPFCNAIMNNVVTISIQPLPSVYAGSDNTICEASSYSIYDASMENYSSIDWIVLTGSGSFDDAHIANPVFIPDNVNEPTNMELVAYVYGMEPCADDIATDTIKLTVEPLPVAEISIDTVVICASDFYHITNADTSYSSGVTWTVEPVGFGDFDSPDIIDPIFTPANITVPTYLTLYLSADGIGNCIGETVQDSVIILVEPLPIADIPGDTAVICANDIYYIANADTSYSSGVNWSVAPAGFGSFDNPDLIDPIFTPANIISPTYLTLYLSASGIGGCSGEVILDSIVLFVEPLPIVDIQGDSAVVCESGAFYITNADTSFSSMVNWTVSPPGFGAFDNSSIIDPTFIPENIIGPTYLTLFLTAYGMGDCSDETTLDSLVLLVEPLPEIYAGADEIICESETYTISDATAQFSTSYNWEIVDGLGAFTNSNILNTVYQPLDIIVPTDVTLVLHAYGEGECSDEEVTDTLVITIEPLPEVYAGADTVICNNEPYHILDDTVNVYSALFWEAIPPEAGVFDDPSVLNPVFTPAENQVGLVVLTLTATGTTICSGATSSDELYVYVNPVPNSDFAFSDVSCNPGQVDFTGSFTPPPVVETWEWNFGDNNSSTTQWPTHIYADTGNYIVQLITIGTNGCSDTVEQTVYVEPELKVDFSSHSECVGTTLQFDGEIILPGTAVIAENDWVWDFGDGSSTVIGQSVEHIYGSSGIHTVILTATDQNGCTFEVFHNDTAFALPEPDFNYSTNLTFINFTNITPEPWNITSWEWHFGDGLTSFEQNPVHEYLNSGVYEVTLIAVNENGCIDSITKLVERPSFIVSDFTIDGSLYCSKYVIDFVDNSSDPSLIENWKWSFGDGATLNYSEYIPTVSHVYSQSGDFTVRLVVFMTMDGSIISDTSYQQISIVATPYADFENSVTCFGDSTWFTDITNSFGIPLSYWEWSFESNNAFEPNPAYLFSNVGDNEVSLIVRNDSGCQDTIVKSVTIHALPEAGFSYFNACIGQKVEFFDETNVTDGDVIKWWWDFGDTESVSDTADIEEPFYIYNSMDTYDVQLNVSDEFGCIDSIVSGVTIHSVPVSDFTLIPNFEGVQGQIKFENQSKGAISYLWDFEYDNGFSSTEKDPVYSYKYDGEYIIELIATTSDNCMDTTYKTYNMLFTGLYVPNAFSPADPNPAVREFLPSGVGLKNFRIEVYDIWGALVWSSTALTTDGQPKGPGWDGTYKGKDMPSGVYMWKAYAVFVDGTIWKGSDLGDGNGPQTQGSLLLIR